MYPIIKLINFEAMYIIKKEFHFCASHQLKGLPENHPCGRMHGHNYIVIMELQSEKLDENGFVLDYGELKDIEEFLNSVFDHRHLNYSMSKNPTAENIAKYIFDSFRTLYPQLIAVTVKETPKTEATYRHEKPTF